MNVFSTPHRRHQAELMDAPDLDAQKHFDALDGLGRINWISRSDAVFWPCLRSILQDWDQDRPLRVLDVAAGGCDVIIRLHGRVQRAGFNAEFTACDISPRALEFGVERATAAGLPIKTVQCDVLRDGVPEGYDVILNALFLHHLAAEEVVAFLRSAASVAGTALIIQDLLRSPLGLFLAHTAPRILTRSDVVHIDGLRSAQAAFSLEEMKAMAAVAGLTQLQYSRHWPERFRMIWRNR